MRNSNKKKSGQELKMNVSKTYKLRHLWQWHSEQIAFTSNAQNNPAFSRKSLPISRHKSTFLSNIPCVVSFYYLRGRLKKIFELMD